MSFTKFILLSVTTLQLFQSTTSFLTNPNTKGRSSAYGRGSSISKIAYLANTKLLIQPATDGETNSLIAEPNAKPQGYMSSDLSSNEDGKQGRVFAYILFALVPVLFLVPFFLSRGFEPPVDPDMAPTTTISSKTTQKWYRPLSISYYILLSTNCWMPVLQLTGRGRDITDFFMLSTASVRRKSC